MMTDALLSLALLARFPKEAFHSGQWTDKSGVMYVKIKK